MAEIAGLVVVVVVCRRWVRLFWGKVVGRVKRVVKTRRGGREEHGDDEELEELVV